jgi:ATP-binding cassette subfamily B protein
VAAALAGAVLPVGFALLSGVAVDAVPAAIEGGLGSAGGRRLLWAAMGLGGLFVAQQALGPVTAALGRALGRRIRRHLYLRSMAATMAPPTIAHLEDPALLDLVADATTLHPVGPRWSVSSLVAMWRRWLMGAAGVALLATYRWWLALLLLATALAYQRRARDVYAAFVAFRMVQLPELRRAVYLRGLALEPHPAKEVRVFGLAGWVVERFRAAWLAPMAEIWRRRRGGWTSVAVGLVPMAAVVLAALVLVGREGATGGAGAGSVAVYAQAVLVSLMLAVPADDLAVAQGAATARATADLERAVAEDPRLRLGGTRAVAAGPRHEIRFEAVRFAYPGGPEVLRGIDLVIPAGRSLAVVGDNGAGKTTLVKLLARLYDPTAGRITVDGVDLRTLDPHQWQRRVAAVFQDFVRWPLTAAENIAIGAGREAVREAAARAGVLEVVERLPGGWDTPLSREFAGGVDVSGGEWQRVALARALLAARSRPGAVLVLDEPTANLDVRAEAAFYERFLDVARGCTTVLVSHRFSTVRRADRIVVLEGGRVVEDGNHHDLVDQGGRYARLFALQAARFDG